MRFAFVQRDLYDYLGLMTLTGVLKKQGHEVRVVVDFNTKRILRQLGDFAPDAVGFNAMIGTTYEDALSLGALIRQHLKSHRGEAPAIVLGGSYPTMFRDIVMEPAVDYLLRGECEEAVGEFASLLEGDGRAETIQNLSYKTSDGVAHHNPLRPLVRDLATLPWPDRSEHYKHKDLRAQRRKNFIISRGCPYSCAYCYNATYKKLYNRDGRDYFRTRPAQDVVAEVAHVAQTYGLRYVGFMDDTVPTNGEWIAEFAELYPRRVGKPFILAAIADFLNEEKIAHLARAGCDVLAVGVETASEESRKGVLERNRIKNDKLHHILTTVRKHGIKLLTFNMLGIPGETLQDGWNTVNFNASVGAELPRFTILTPTKGTKMEESVKELGLVQDEDLVHMAGPYVKKSILRQEGIEKLVRLQKVAYFAVLYPRWRKVYEWLVEKAPNPLLDMVYLAGNGQLFVKINQWSLFTTAKYALAMLRWYK